MYDGWCGHGLRGDADGLSLVQGTEVFPARVGNAPDQRKADRLRAVVIMRDGDGGRVRDVDGAEAVSAERDADGSAAGQGQQRAAVYPDAAEEGERAPVDAVALALQLDGRDPYGRLVRRGCVFLRIADPHAVRRVPGGRDGIVRSKDDAAHVSLLYTAARSRRRRKAPSPRRAAGRFRPRCLPDAACCPPRRTSRFSRR